MCFVASPVLRHQSIAAIPHLTGLLSLSTGSLSSGSRGQRGCNGALLHYFRDMLRAPGLAAAGAPRAATRAVAQKAGFGRARKALSCSW